MCITVHRHFHCVEDLDRLPGQPIPQPSSGNWPYDNAPVSQWPAEGKNHSLFFIARCSHPSYPEVDGGLGLSDAPMCFSRLEAGPPESPNGAEYGGVAEWFDEPCPDCNGLDMKRSTVMSFPVRTLDPSSFEPTDWDGVATLERRLIQRYADRLAELCAHSMGTIYVNEQRDQHPVLVDPYWDPALKRTPANVTFLRLRVALRELTCDQDATHGPLWYPLFVLYTSNPWKDQKTPVCLCELTGTGPSGLPVIQNGAVNSRRQMAFLMLVTMDHNCALERWGAADIREVTRAAREHKASAGPGFVPMEENVQRGGLPRHTKVLTAGRALDVVTATSRRRNLELFAEELRANLTLDVSDVHRYSHWEDLLSRLLAEDSGISLRWARMILWRILTDYWKAAQGFVSRPSHAFCSPSHQLAVLSETWRTNLLATRIAGSEQEAETHHALLFDDYIQNRAFLQIHDNIAKERRRVAATIPFTGWLGGTPRATPDELLALISKGEADCGICREPLAEHLIKLPRQSRQCLAAGLDHWFGSRCLMEWVKSCDLGHASCPLCRRPIGCRLTLNDPTYRSVQEIFPVPLPQDFDEIVRQSLGSDDQDSEVNLNLLEEYQKPIWTPFKVEEYKAYLRTIISSW